jgi:hypothetical protein
MCRLLFLLLFRPGSCLLQLTIGSVFLLTGAVCGQDIIWSRAYGGPDGEEGVRLCETSDGGYIMVGNTESFGNWVQIYLVRTDARGDTLWTRTFGGDGLEYGNSVHQTSDGGYIIGGWTTSFGLGAQAYLIKTDSRGNALWSRTYGGSDIDDGMTVQQTSDGGYILVGGTYSYGAGGKDVYLVKTDPLGQSQWSKTYGGVKDDAGLWVELASDGGFIITGFTESFAPHRWVYLLKTNSEGDTVWTKTPNPSGSYWSEGDAIQQTSDSGYIMTGFCVTNSHQSSVYDFFLIKTDLQGDTVWTRTYDRDDFDWPGSVRQTFDGGYIVAGMTLTYESGSGPDSYVIKTDSEGDTLWTRNFGGAYAWDVQQTPDSNYVVVGGIALNGLLDFYLLKISSSPLATLRGDANGDEVINVSDVIYLVNYVLKGGPAPEPLKAGDPNCDLWIDLEDVIYLVRYLFLHGPEPGVGCDKAES